MTLVRDGRILQGLSRYVLSRLEEEGGGRQKRNGHRSVAAQEIGSTEGCGLKVAIGSVRSYNNQCVPAISVTESKLIATKRSTQAQSWVSAMEASCVE